MDRVALPGVDLVHDARVFPWPIEDDAFDVVSSSHFLEHLPDLVRTMEEIHRILKPGGRLEVVVPYYRWEGAFRDPTHVRFFTEHTFDYFTPEGATDLSHLNYYSKARFTIESLRYGWEGRLVTRIERRVENGTLRRILNGILRNPRTELRVVLRALK